MRHWIDMTASAHDIARELRNRLPHIGVVKMHKLLYYAQGHHLVMFGTRLFEQPIEAWANGPVVAALWADEKHGRGRPPADEVPGEALETIEYVVGRYGHLTGRQLIDKTHAEDPWRSVSESDDPALAGDPRITDDVLRKWFEQDPEHLAYKAEAERLRARRDVFTLEPRPLTPAEHAAIDRVRRGERVNHWRG